MARIELQGPSGACCVDYSINGAVVQVGNVTVNCEEMQGDHQRLIDICADEGGFSLGAIQGKPFVMNIIIPPKQYVEVGDGTDESGNPKTRREALPLNASEITIRLWPYAGQSQNQ